MILKYGADHFNRYLWSGDGEIEYAKFNYVNANDSPYNFYGRPCYQEFLDIRSQTTLVTIIMDISFGLILNLGWEIQGGVYIESVDNGNMILLMQLLRKIVPVRNIVLKVDNGHYFHMIFS